jgi:hypothetical protein
MKLDDAKVSYEPKSLQTLISEEEMEIAVDTLRTLTKYPSAIKAKGAKELRAAVYDFRMACTTGTNNAGGRLSLLPSLISHRQRRSETDFDLCR